MQTQHKKNKWLKPVIALIVAIFAGIFVEHYKKCMFRSKGTFPSSQKGKQAESSTSLSETKDDSFQSVDSVEIIKEVPPKNRIGDSAIEEHYQNSNTTQIKINDTDGFSVTLDNRLIGYEIMEVLLNNEPVPPIAGQYFLHNVRPSDIIIIIDKSGKKHFYDPKSN